MRRIMFMWLIDISESINLATFTAIVASTNKIMKQIETMI